MMKNKATHILTKIAVNIGRLLMAITFIFSGFVKGIDPLGTQYKITDYLEALHIDWMFPSWSTLLMSIVLAMCEFAIGIFLLLAIRRKLVSKIALRVMSVMTLITLWIVIADPVKDCGCFGDAIVLTNMDPSDTAHHTLAMLHRKRCPARQVLPTTLLRCVERMER